MKNDKGSNSTPRREDRFIQSHTFLAGKIRKVADNWVFSNMTAGKAAPLSVKHYYFNEKEPDADQDGGVGRGR